MCGNCSELRPRAAAEPPASEALVAAPQRFGWAVVAAAGELASRRAFWRPASPLLRGNLEIITALFGVAHLGAISAQISLRQEAEGFRHILSDCQAGLLLHGPCSQDAAAAWGGTSVGIDRDDFAHMRRSSGAERHISGKEDPALVIYSAPKPDRPAVAGTSPPSG